MNFEEEETFIFDLWQNKEITEEMWEFYLRLLEKVKELTKEIEELQNTKEDREVK